MTFRCWEWINIQLLLVKKIIKVNQQDFEKRLDIKKNPAGVFIKSTNQPHISLHHFQTLQPEQQAQQVVETTGPKLFYKNQFTSVALMLIHKPPGRPLLMSQQTYWKNKPNPLKKNQSHLGTERLM